MRSGVDPVFVASHQSPPSVEETAGEEQDETSTAAHRHDDTSRDSSGAQQERKDFRGFHAGNGQARPDGNEEHDGQRVRHPVTPGAAATG
ncbi:hypothetical protein WDH52_22960 [Streptomyces sp. TRM70308]|uniref:hypothetical protein n=1 Tax=Streptomyces sp. TRM70308 TaxID=3131932 RepID=UPI003CFCBDE4